MAVFSASGVSVDGADHRDDCGGWESEIGHEERATRLQPNRIGFLTQS